MKLWKVMIVVLFIAFAGITCGSKGDSGDGGGAGGPASSPVDQKVADSEATAKDSDGVVADADKTGTTDEVGNAVVAADTDNKSNPDDGVVTTDSSEGSTGTGSSDGATGTGDSGQGTGDAGQGTGDSGQGTGDTGQSTSDTDQGTGDSGQVDADDADEPTGDCPGRSVTLDTSYGKWFNSPEGVLVDSGDWKDTQAKIKEARAKLKELKKAKNKDKAAIKALRNEIKELQDKHGYANKTGGIWTAWANQNLYLKVRNNCKPGWYNLVVVAKNIYGPLPDFYDNFNLTVRNETTGKYVGGLFVKATDKKYKRGTVKVYLPEGNTDLNLLWTNDAYEQGKYDANIQINKVVLKFAGSQAPYKGLKRNAFQYNFIEGTWYWDANTVRTYWANQVIGFDYSNIKPGKYEVIVTAKNYGTVPAKYKDFSVKVETDDGASGVLAIKADADKFAKGKVILDITAPTNVYLTWTNDMWVPDKGEDANIQIKSIRLKKVGKSERSPLAAYLVAKTAKNKFLVGGIFFSVALVLGGLFAWNRKRMRVRS